jgi:Myb-like DNA-binding domain
LKKKVEKKKLVIMSSAVEQQHMSSAKTLASLLPPATAAQLSRDNAAIQMDGGAAYESSSALASLEAEAVAASHDSSLLAAAAHSESSKSSSKSSKSKSRSSKKRATIMPQVPELDDDCEDGVVKFTNNFKLKPSHKNVVRRASRGRWTSREDEILASAVVQFKGTAWKKVADLLPGRTDVQCLHRWQKVLNPELVKGPWTKEEDERMKALVAAHGPQKWSLIAKELGGRIGKQCRERWLNHLDPAINKDPWSDREDALILQRHSQMGNSWARISHLLPGRTANMIKNHWHSDLCNRIKSAQGSYSQVIVGLGFDIDVPITVTVEHQMQERTLRAQRDLDASKENVSTRRKQKRARSTSAARRGQSAAAVASGTVAPAKQQRTASGRRGLSERATEAKPSAAVKRAQQRRRHNLSKESGGAKQQRRGRGRPRLVGANTDDIEIFADGSTSSLTRRRRTKRSSAKRNINYADDLDDDDAQYNENDDDDDDDASDNNSDISDDDDDESEDDYESSDNDDDGSRRHAVAMTPVQCRDDASSSMFPLFSFSPLNTGIYSQRTSGRAAFASLLSPTRSPYGQQALSFSPGTPAILARRALLSTTPAASNGRASSPNPVGIIVDGPPAQQHRQQHEQQQQHQMQRGPQRSSSAPFVHRLPGRPSLAPPQQQQQQRSLLGVPTPQQRIAGRSDPFSPSVFFVTTPNSNAESGDSSSSGSGSSGGKHRRTAARRTSTVVEQITSDFLLPQRAGDNASGDVLAPIVGVQRTIAQAMSNRTPQSGVHNHMPRLDYRLAQSTASPIASLMSPPTSRSPQTIDQAIRMSATKSNANRMALLQAAQRRLALRTDHH